jgi:hypothetical protein
MSLTTAGATEAAKCAINDSPTYLNASNAYLGVGDSTTAFSAAQTDLQASTNKVRQGMDATYPIRSGAAVTFRATFATSQANFAWQEWGVFNAASTGVMWGRKVESLGTKTNTQAWQLTPTITFTAA